MLDSNVVIDLLEADQPWTEWSLDAFVRAERLGSMAIGSVIVGELAASGRNLAQAMQQTFDFGVAVHPLSSDAAAHVGEAQHRYRAAGGTREKLLGDFLIGGHALSVGATLITRDPRRYRRDFPDLALVAPD